jgi:hypothetical protein
MKKEVIGCKKGSCDRRSFLRSAGTAVATAVLLPRMVMSKSIVSPENCFGFREVGLAESGSSYLIAKIPERLLGFSPKYVWCPVPGRGHRTEPYAIPKTVKMGTHPTAEASAKLTPPPFAVVVQNDDAKSLICVGASGGNHLWNFVDFAVESGGIEVRIDFEGHTLLSKVKCHVKVIILPAEPNESSMSLLSRGLKILYPDAYEKSSATEKPSWWHRPIYCGWGDQVGLMLDLEGPGSEARALAYNTQGLYQRWIDRLKQADVPVGTIIVDAGWSQAGVWQPNPVQWPDLRGFVDAQHKEGRRVLLWIATWLYEGLPDRWCIHAGKTKLVADPTNREYRSFIKENIYRLLSPKQGCFNADGFEIDQLRYTPSEHILAGGEQFGRTFELEQENSEHKIKLSGTKWGCELLYQLQKDIYTAAKSAKPDALIDSSTANPYFYDTLDILRLHDTGSIPKDVFKAMKARADLVRAVLPDALIDTDNWIIHDYNQWLNYTLTSYRLGVPCLCYTERFVNSLGKQPVTRPIEMEVLRNIGQTWQKLL